ncbi:hypothetical protein NOGI109294_12630 [Nocardiopsis gilva]
MDLAIFGELNWLAVIVAALVYVGLGPARFARPVFGNAWMRAIDWAGDMALSDLFKTPCGARS